MQQQVADFRTAPEAPAREDPPFLLAYGQKLVLCASRRLTPFSRCTSSTLLAVQRPMSVILSLA